MFFFASRHKKVPTHDLIASLLEDQSRRVRARAVDFLEKLAPAPFQALRSKLSCPHEEIKMAAIQALIRLDCSGIALTHRMRNKVLEQLN